MDGDELYGAGLVDPCPRSLSAGARPSAPAYSIRPDVVELGADEEPLAPGDAELVYVGFGTVPIYRDDPQLLTTVVRSLVAAGCRLVVTTSNPSLGASLRAIDERRVDVRRWVSLSRVVPACRLAVCHGGAGTVLAALTAGTPLLLLPRGAPSQTRMSAACDGRGVARVLDTNEISAASVDAALADLMHDDRFRQNARDVAREIAEMPGADAVVPWLEMAGPA